MPGVDAARFFRGLIVGAAALIALAPVQQATARPYGPYATTPGQAAVAATLDGIRGTSTGDRARMLNALDALPTSAARADALAQLSAQSYTMLPHLAIQSMDAVDRDIRNHLVERRSVASDAPNSVPLNGDKTINMVLTGGVRQAKYEARPDRPEAKSDSRSIGFGIDVTPRKGLLVGAMVGIDGLDAKLDPNRPRVTMFSTHIGSYASYSNGKFYIDADAAYSFSEYKLRREVRYTGFLDRLTSSANGDNWMASAEAGLMLRQGKVRIQPFAGIQYRYAQVGGFTETGGAAALDVATYRTRSLRGTAGARLSTTFNVGKWAIRPTVSGEWQREMRPHPDSLIEARFATRDLAIFSLKPYRLARDAGSATAGITATYNSRTSIRIAYSDQFSNDRRVHATMLSISRRF